MHQQADEQPTPPQRRQIWSKQDSITLTKLVDSRAASWSYMEKVDHRHFKIPRNAQAYRDKTRNMKVDFLISDAALPRGFDLVTLNRKETKRLQMLGKNAGRLETFLRKKSFMHTVDS